jgi:hypothetical protein
LKTGSSRTRRCATRACIQNRGVCATPLRETNHKTQNRSINGALRPSHRVVHQSIPTIYVSMTMHLALLRAGVARCSAYNLLSKNSSQNPSGEEPLQPRYSRIRAPTKPRFGACLQTLHFLTVCWSFRAFVFNVPHVVSLLNIDRIILPRHNIGAMYDSYTLQSIAYGHAKGRTVSTKSVI